MKRVHRLGVALFLLGAILLGLASASGLALAALHRADDRVDATTAARLRWAALSDAVAAEAFAEAGYRRAPSNAARSEIGTSIRDLSTVAEQVRSAGGRRDRALVSYLLVLNRQYAAEVYRTLDLPRAQLLDDRVAGPGLDAIHRLIEGSLEGRRLDQDAARADRDGLFLTLNILMPAVFLLALVCLVACWRVVTREHGRVVEVATTNESLALSDPLTGLANREALRRRLLVELDPEESRSGSLLLIDLDHFKPVNDTWGHSAGDVVLCVMAARLRDASPQALAVRLGGDEFALLVPGSTPTEFLAGRLARSLGRPVELADATVTVGVSIGVAQYPGDGVTQLELLKAADDALYAAKAAGRGCIRMAERSARHGV